MRIDEVLLSKILIDDGVLLRQLDDDVATQYEMYLRRGEHLPPIDLFFDGHVYRLANGRHRCRAHELADRQTISAVIHDGGFLEAERAARVSNYEHGLPRTNKVKRLAVRRALLDAEWREWSNRDIACRCHVHHDMVVKMRAKMVRAGEIPDVDKVKFKRGGKTHEMKPVASGVSARYKASEQEKQPLKKTTPRQEKIAKELREAAKKEGWDKPKKKKTLKPRLSAQDRRQRDMTLEFLDDNQTSAINGADAIRLWGAYELGDKFDRTIQWMVEARDECRRGPAKEQAA